MGMNYYAVRNKASLEHPIHIGKSSFGWFFCFQTQSEPWQYSVPVVWNTYKQVIDWLRKYTVERNDYVILDEEDEVVSFEDFVKMVEDKQNDEKCRSNPDNFQYSKNVDGYRFTDGDFS